MSLGVKQNTAPSSGNTGLIREVAFVETVATYQNSDQYFDLFLDANDYVNKQIVCRTIGSFGTYTFNLTQYVTIENFGDLANGESIILKFEQKDGLGNPSFELSDSDYYGSFDVAPWSTYMITRTSEAMALNQGFTVVCLDDAMNKVLAVSSGLSGRQVGFGVYRVVGDGSPTTQILIPVAATDYQQEVIILNSSSNICKVSSTGLDNIYGSSAITAVYDCPRGISRFRYANGIIYTI